MDFQRTPEWQKKRAAFIKDKLDNDTGNRDFLFKEKVPIFTPHDGDNSIRILPGSWTDAVHYGYELWAHYSIGLSKSAFLCLEKMNKGEACPVCAEYKKAVQRQDAEYAKSINSQHRVLAYVIDRNAEDTGPLVWSMPYVKVARVLMGLSYDRRTGEVVTVEDPEHGHDISFRKRGKGLLTQYEELKIEFRETPLSSDGKQAKKWIDYITAKSIPDLLQFKTVDHIKNVLLGNVEEPEISKPITSSKGEEPTSVPSNGTALNADIIQSMKRRDLEELIKTKGLDIDPSDYEDSRELAQSIILELNLM